MQQQILGRDKVTNRLWFSISVGSCNILSHSIMCTYLIIKSTPKKVVYDWLGVLQFSRKAFAQFWFHWVLIHTHTQRHVSCALDLASIRKVIYIYIIYLFMDWFFDGKLNFSKHLLFIKFLQKEKEKKFWLKTINPSNFTKVTKLKGGLIGDGFTGMDGRWMGGMIGILYHLLRAKWWIAPFSVAARSWGKFTHIHQHDLGYHMIWACGLSFIPHLSVCLRL
jgi:hypothetical protein